MCCVTLPPNPSRPALISGVRSAIVREPTSVQADSPFTLSLTCLLRSAVRHVLSQYPDRSSTPVIRVQAPLHLAPVLVGFGAGEVEDGMTRGDMATHAVGTAEVAERIAGEEGRGRSFVEPEEEGGGDTFDPFQNFRG